MQKKISILRKNNAYFCSFPSWPPFTTDTLHHADARCLLSIRVGMGQPHLDCSVLIGGSIWNGSDRPPSEVPYSLYFFVLIGKMLPDTVRYSSPCFVSCPIYIFDLWNKYFINILVTSLDSCKKTQVLVFSIKLENLIILPHPYFSLWNEDTKQLPALAQYMPRFLSRLNKQTFVWGKDKSHNIKYGLFSIHHIQIVFKMCWQHRGIVGRGTMKCAVISPECEIQHSLN